MVLLKLMLLRYSFSRLIRLPFRSTFPFLP